MSDRFRCLDTGTPMSVRREHFRRIVSVDQCPDLSWIDDEARLADYDADGWHMIGIKAAATFLIPLNGHHVIQIVETPGLWNIESDSDDAYLDAVYADECAELAAMLNVLGVSVTV
jgi:hypothetical protein